MDIPVYLPVALQFMRRLKGLSQAEAARRAGMKPSQLSKYEKNVLPKLPQVARLLDAYEATLFDLARILAVVRDSKSALGAAAGGAGEIRERAGTILLREGGMLVPKPSQHLVAEIMMLVTRLLDSVEEAQIGRGLRAGFADYEPIDS